MPLNTHDFRYIILRLKKAVWVSLASMISTVSVLRGLQAQGFYQGVRVYRVYGIRGFSFGFVKGFDCSVRFVSVRIDVHSCCEHELHFDCCLALRRSFIILAFKLMLIVKMSRHAWLPTGLIV